MDTRVPPLWLAVHLPSTSLSPELERLACWAGGFTPRVSLAPPAALLLEIGGCLRLFGGVEAIVAQVAAELTEQGVKARIAVASRPQAALWRAEGNGAELDMLPLAALSLPAGTAERLARFGIRRLGELRRLTFAALARRIGKEAMLRVARAYGEAPDPRPDFAFPEHFGQGVELPAPVEAAPALLFAARRLTAALAGWLAARQLALRECVLELRHRQGMTPLPLRFAEATRDAGRLERVLKERLERLPLAAPVEALHLAATAVEAQPGASLGLFDDPAGRESLPALVERLRARLGEARVYGLEAIADHRPECATAQVPAGRDSGVAAAGPRPFWLLARPEALAEIAGRPHKRGPLQLLAGPERIESGWWQEGEMRGEGTGDLRRDYFVARTQDRRWAWIFRELRPPGGWYLHGWFA